MRFIEAVLAARSEVLEFKLFLASRAKVWLLNLALFIDVRAPLATVLVQECTLREAILFLLSTNGSVFVLG